MRGKWLAVALILIWLFRDRLLALVAPQQEMCVPALLVATVGSIFIYFTGYSFVISTPMRAVWQVALLISFGGTLIGLLSHWLTTFPIFGGDFWCGAIAGAMESALLWGALYGAKEVWVGPQE